VWRRERAAEQGMPAFVVMNDTTLRELARRRPRTLDELGEVPGFGAKRTARYGESLLTLLSSAG
jgi:ATP-dependent DNA helicase RecQ